MKDSDGSHSPNQENCHYRKKHKPLKTFIKNPIFLPALIIGLGLISADSVTAQGFTVFALSVPSQLTIIPSSPNLILTWPTNFAAYTLQSTTDIVPAAVWTTNSLPPRVVNGQFAVTNLISATQQFYRLSQ